MEIVFETPTVYVLGSIIIAIIFSYFLYKIEIKADRFKPQLVWILSALRFSSVFIICFLLLGVLLKSSKTETEKPIIAIALDDSESILLGHDSAFVQDFISSKIPNLVSQFNDGYQVEIFAFSNPNTINESISIESKETNISNVIETLRSRYYQRNLGALILATDGLYNSGKNPIYAKRINAPIYSIALGDTTERQDILISDINYNKLAFLGNKFPLNILVNAYAAKGETIDLKVKEDGKTVASKSFTLQSDNELIEETFLLEAKNIGFKKYTIEVSNLTNEVSTSNNTTYAFIEILDSKQKILILANSPHPDIAAIKNSLRTKENYEIEFSLAKDLQKTLTDYDLVVLHQLPSINNKATEIINTIEKNNLSTFTIVGAQSDYRSEWIKQFFTVEGLRKSLIDNKVLLNENFELFQLDADSKSIFNLFPPLKSPVGNYSFSKIISPLLWQQVGSIITENPLMGMLTTEHNKKGFFLGDGLWRWRMYNYLEKDNHLAFDQFMQKTIQFLANKEKRSPFKINNKLHYNENEVLVFDAELYNASFESVNSVDVNITIKDELENTYPFVFSPYNKGYRSKIGKLPAGHYTYTAETTLANKALKNSGAFSISAVQKELIQTKANHTSLFQLAKATGGSVFYPNQLNELSSELLSSENIVSVSYQRDNFTDLIDLKWILFLLLSLLSLEWFLRKRNGTY